MSWPRRHWRGLVVLVVVLAVGGFQSTYGSWKFYRTQDPVGATTVRSGETVTVKGARVRLVEAKVREALDSYGDQPASHPPRTKFVTVSFRATMLTKVGASNWQGADVQLRASDGRTWSDGSLTGVSDANFDTVPFGGGVDDPVPVGQPADVVLGFVVPADVEDFTVAVTVGVFLDITGGKNLTSAQELRFEP